MLVALFFICATAIIVTQPLRCYEGSKGEIRGKIGSHFSVNICDEGMIHCFESYSDDLTEITASCQTLNTEDKLLNVCNETKQKVPRQRDANPQTFSFEARPFPAGHGGIVQQSTSSSYESKVGCQKYPALNVTVCCCDEDLCNLPDSEKPTESPDEVRSPPHRQNRFKLSNSL